MLLGLVLMAINLQSAMEKLLLYVFCFWERKSMRTVLKKNLISHKRKNKLTSVIFALSLGSTIFLLTSASLQLNNINEFVNVGDADINVQLASWANAQ